MPNDKTVLSIVREYLEEAETKTARLQERVRELEEFLCDVRSANTNATDLIEAGPRLQELADQAQKLQAKKDRT